MTDMDDKTPIYVIKLAGLMFVATLAAMVAMTVAGQDTASIERVVGPLLSAVILTGVVGAIAQAQRKAHDEHTQELQQIKRQTNGVLDERIEEGTKRALRSFMADRPEEVTPPSEPPTAEHHH